MILKSKLEKDVEFNKQQQYGAKMDVEINKQEEGAKRLEKFWNIYYEMIDDRMGNFQQVKSYLERVLEELLEEQKVGRGVILLSRVKSPVSVIENLKLGKNIHDIFGITLLTQTEEESKEIRQRLRDDNNFNISSKKEMNQKRGYEAIHFLFNVEREGNEKVNVECHMQTHEAYKNVYPHVYYKVRRRLDRDLTPEDEKDIEKKIQSMFDNGNLAGAPTINGRRARLPQMWVSTFNAEGKMEEMELDETQKLLIMYPFLDISHEEAEER